MNLAAIQRGHLHAAEKASEALLVTALQCERTFSKKVCAKLTSPLRRRLRQDSDGRDYASHTEPKGEYHEFPSFTAERSLYRSSRHYRASALPSLVGGVRPSDGSLPDGSYLQSCPSCTLLPGFLSADLECSCYDESGNLQDTYLFAAPFCLGDIYNTNGVLGCDQGGPG